MRGSYRTSRECGVSMQFGFTVVKSQATVLWLNEIKHLALTLHKQNRSLSSWCASYMRNVSKKMFDLSQLDIFDNEYSSMKWQPIVLFCKQSRPVTSGPTCVTAPYIANTCIICSSISYHYDLCYPYVFCNPKFNVTTKNLKIFHSTPPRNSTKGLSRESP